MKYYLDTDLRENLVMIAPFHVDSDTPWLIVFESRWQADQFFKQMMIGNKKDPIDSPDSYERIDEVEGVTRFKVKEN